MGISFIIFLQRIVGMRRELPLEGRGLAQIIWSAREFPLGLNTLQRWPLLWLVVAGGLDFHLRSRRTYSSTWSLLDAMHQSPSLLLPSRRTLVRSPLLVFVHGSKTGLTLLCTALLSLACFAPWLLSVGPNSSWILSKQLTPPLRPCHVLVTGLFPSPELELIVAAPQSPSEFISAMLFLASPLGFSFEGSCGSRIFLS
ncbi:hypothetical protein GmHk_18G051993 [Glycine max]|nr:hypothetical protein GmHk_18G051993 [Glycine max]